MESARDHVFRLPELLELVLSHLSQKELLLSQRVSRRFRATITESPKLQRLLFLLPDWRLTHQPPTATRCPPPHQPTNNRLILRAFPGCYPTISLIIATSNTQQPQQHHHHNPILPAAAAAPTTQSTFRRAEHHRTWDVCIAFPASHPPRCTPSVDYPEASWRRMYLCQPPCQKLYLVRRWQRSRSPAIVRDAGITMGDFYDEATKSQSWHPSFISSDRDWHFEGSLETVG